MAEPATLRRPLFGKWRHAATYQRVVTRSKARPVIPRCLSCELRLTQDDHAIRLEMERRVTVWLRTKGL